MESLVDTLNRLKLHGYKHELCRSKDLPSVLPPEEFMIDKAYRIDESSDPNEQVVVYAVSSKDGKIKGIVINGFGINSDPICDKLISRLEVKEDSEKAG